MYNIKIKYNIDMLVKQSFMHIDIIVKQCFMFIDMIVKKTLYGYRYL